MQKNEGDENGGGGKRCDFRFEDLVKDVLKIWVLQAQLAYGKKKSNYNISN